MFGLEAYVWGSACTVALYAALISAIELIVPFYEVSR